MNTLHNSNEQSLPDREVDVLAFWQKNNIFNKVVEARAQGQPFIFYDGPPFATGLPHYGHILQMSNKDAVLRYKTMRGFNVPRKIGWDTHGLPVEYELEKELGISGKRQIEEYGIEKFVQAARSIVLRYTKEWGTTMARMGRWMDLESPYATMDNDYIESVWWAFNELHKKGLIYKDFRVSPYCPRCGTVLSNFEVNQGYKDDVQDPSIYVSFPLKDSGGDLTKANLVVWTTTPWTLPSNIAVAVDSENVYAIIQVGDQKLIVDEEVAQEKFHVKQADENWITTIKGQDLVNKRYEPLYRMTDDLQAYQVIDGGDEIISTEGTGLVHIAPAYGEFDFSLGRKYDLPLIQSVTNDGIVEINKNIPGEGKFVKQADKDIIDDLKDRHLLIKDEQIKHTYPFCWRCTTPLLYYPATSWFVKVTAIKDTLVSENKTIAWQPEHLRHGRFGKWLEGARDWAISRNRFWGAPLPIWECEKCDKIKIISSAKDLDQSLDGKSNVEDLHRPYIDEIKFTCSCGGTMKRVPFVFDCWFESGSMPFAQHHYPFERKQEFMPDKGKGYPADFIAEALDQTRGWFYTLHVLGVALFSKHAYDSVVVTGLLLAPDGKKLSKSMRNYTAPEVLFDTIGVDPFRLFLFTATTLGEDYRFSDTAIADVKRRWITPLINVVTYYTLSLAERSDTVTAGPHHIFLDRWIKARVAQAWEEVDSAMDGQSGRSPFDLVRAGRTFGPLVEDLSTWYIRLSRGRKDVQFIETLRAVLIRMFELYAPFLPFLTESLYQSIRFQNEEESIHLRLANLDRGWESEAIIEQMNQVRAVVSSGRELRAKVGIPNRQPLNTLEMKANITQTEALDLIRDELQVDTVRVQNNAFSEEFATSDTVALDTSIPPDLKIRGNANLVRRTIQDLRKRAQLQSTDHAIATIEGAISDDLLQAIAAQLPHTKLESAQITAVDAAEVTIDEVKLRINVTKSH